MDEAEPGLPAGSIVGTTKATLRGKPVQTCTIIFPEVDGDAFGR
ncbi:hypothetical protein [Mycoplana ramosa]